LLLRLTRLAPARQSGHYALVAGNVFVCGGCIASGRTDADRR
jgi:hypothetical protein